MRTTTSELYRARAMARYTYACILLDGRVAPLHLAEHTLAWQPINWQTGKENRSAPQTPVVNSLVKFT